MGFEPATLRSAIEDSGLVFLTFSAPWYSGWVVGRMHRCPSLKRLPFSRFGLTQTYLCFVSISTTPAPLLGLQHVAPSLFVDCFFEYCHLFVITAATPFGEVLSVLFWSRTSFICVACDISGLGLYSVSHVEVQQQIPSKWGLNLGHPKVILWSFKHFHVGKILWRFVALSKHSIFRVKLG